MAGKPTNDIDLSLDRAVEEAHQLLREAHPDIDPVLMRFERFGMLRWRECGLQRPGPLRSSWVAAAAHVG